MTDKPRPRAPPPSEDLGRGGEATIFPAGPEGEREEITRTLTAEPEVAGPRPTEQQPPEKTGR